MNKWIPTLHRWENGPLRRSLWKYSTGKLAGLGECYSTNSVSLPQAKEPGQRWHRIKENRIIVQLQQRPDRARILASGARQLLCGSMPFQFLSGWAMASAELDSDFDWDVDSTSYNYLAVVLWWTRMEPTKAMADDCNSFDKIRLLLQKKRL